MPCDVVQPRWCLSLVFGKVSAAGRIIGVVGVIVPGFAFVSIDSIGRHWVPGDRPRIQWGVVPFGWCLSPVPGRASAAGRMIRIVGI
ncbi:MAG: hypothetical protein RL215_1147, partial [Planctomycetota bacterium]